MWSAATFWRADAAAGATPGFLGRRDRDRHPLRKQPVPGEKCLATLRLCRVLSKKSEERFLLDRPTHLDDLVTHPFWLEGVPFLTVVTDLDEASQSPPYCFVLISVSKCLTVEYSLSVIQELSRPAKDGVFLPHTTVANHSFG